MYRAFQRNVRESSIRWQRQGLMGWGNRNEHSPGAQKSQFSPFAKVLDMKRSSDASRMEKVENRARTRILEIEKFENENVENFSIHDFRESRIAPGKSAPPLTVE